MSYTDIGLNDQLRAVNSLAGGTSQFVSSTEFDVNNDIPSGYIDNSRVRNITADKIDAGTVTSLLYIGGSSIYIDGANKRIIVNDGTTDRILIGYGSGLF
jgi:hypothetical protein